MSDTNVTNIIAGVEPAIIGEGYELVDARFATEAGQRVLRLYIDNPVGVKLEDCARVSRVIGDLLDVKALVSGRYNLEVSSPGLDRPLRLPEHFERFRGQVASVTLSEPLAGRLRFKGEIVGLKGDKALVAELILVLRVDQQDYLLPFTQIERAHLVPQFETPKPRRS
jgi:ribosome maturation factor RimP